VAVGANVGRYVFDFGALARVGYHGEGRSSAAELCRYRFTSTN
jgi:hypothetical protein